MKVPVVSGWFITAAALAIACYFTLISSRRTSDELIIPDRVLVDNPALPSGSTQLDLTETASADSDSQDRQVAHSAILRHVNSMLTDANREVSESRRERMLVHAVAWIERQGTASILEILGAENSSETMSDLKERLLANLARKNPEAAARVALEQNVAIDGVLATWVNQDPSQAITWVEQLPDGDAKRRAIISVASEAVRTDPQSAVRMAGGLPESAERDEILNRAMAEWVHSAPSDVQTWVQQVEDPSLRSRLMAVVATTLAESDAPTAAQLALTSMEPGKLQNDAVVGIVQRWAQRDPASAASWVAQFPAGDLRDAAIDNLVKLWPSRTEAAAWLNSLPAGPSRDAGFRAYAEQIAPAYPREAAGWAAAIADPQIQAAQLERIIRAWNDRDFASASRWVQTASLTPSIRQRLLAAHN